MILLGLSGKIGCGKTTLARLIMEQAQCEGLNLSFGELLKRECAAYFGFPLDWCYSQEGKDNSIPLSSGTDARLTVRQALQWYGTDFRRRQDPDYWARAMRAKIEQCAAEYAELDPLLLIDDVRFSNEAQMVLDLGGSLVRLDPFDGWRPGPHAGHESETALDNWPTWSLRVAPPLGGLHDVARQVLEMMEPSDADG